MFKITGVLLKTSLLQLSFATAIKNAQQATHKQRVVRLLSMQPEQN